MSQIQEWNYAHDADITFGEVHISKAPKIALAITILSVIAITALCVIYRDILGDIIVNPQLVLTSNEVNVEVFDTFDPKNYISDANIGKYEITDISNNVDTNKLGDYSVTYSSKNSVNELSQDLTVHVVDNIAPVILLKTNDDKFPIKLDNGQYTATIVINSDIAQTFNPEDYIDIIKDNYSSNDKISHECTNNFSFDQVGLITIIYAATDENGNIGNTTLNISVVEAFDEERAEYEQQISEMEEELARLKEQQNNSGHSGNSGGSNGSGSLGNSGNSGGSDNSGGSGSSDNNSGGNSGGSSNSLSASSCTVSMSSVGGTWNGVVIAASGYVHYSGTGNAHAVSGVGITEFPSGPGTYTINWQGDNGLSCTQTVTVTE